MRIVRLEAENVKRLRAVSITPDGAVVRIQGNNGAGKTSVLDAIAYALGGEKLCPAEPIRRGAEKAHVVLELDEDIVVERRWTKSGSRLEVRTKAGAVMKGPQALLDSLVGRLSFDPLAFLRLEAKDQAAALRKIAGIDLSADEAKRKQAYELRTVANRAVAQLHARLMATPPVEAPDAPVSSAALLEEHQARSQAKAANDRVRAELERARAEAATKKRETDATREEVARLREQLAAAEARVALAEAAHLATVQGGKALRAKVDALVDPNLDEIPRQLRDVEAVNDRVRAKKVRAGLEAELAAAKAEAARLDAEVAAVDEAKAKVLAAARFPVAGLGFSETGVTLGGLPLEQASGAEQLRVSLAMGIALNPKLKVLLIRDGSLLDEKSLAMVAEMAERAQAQVWLEVVGKGGVGVVIEDGQVEGAAAPAEAVAS